jgi:hypothetical protein
MSEESKYEIPCDSCVKEGKCGYADWIKLNLSLVNGICVKKTEKTSKKRG